MPSLYFEDAEVGTSLLAGPYLVTKSEITEFAKQYDPVPRHIDEEAAARSIFGADRMHAHTFSSYVLLTPRIQPRLHDLAGMGWDELRQLRLPNAVRPDDALDLEGTVPEKHESKSKPNRGILRNLVHLRNQTRETVLQCISSVVVARRPDAKSIDVSRSIGAVGWFSLRCLLWGQTRK
ncbi:acyl dehydratase [Bradyrhizobium sp. AZCC 1693]|uniref:acyl dehydratase n=1 Tax=Bradyrhizobium sp. AZCC 1693 TaxID=3117029 RepID=UPI002FF2EBF6